MLIRITDGNSGVKQYLERGQKQGREFSRSELDQRIILDGDLELTDKIINSMHDRNNRYMHITLSFKEDYISESALKEITNDFKHFAFSAFDDDEFNFYAEAHLPKIKSYQDKSTGNTIERKPHIHIIIPQQNLLSDKHLNPFGKVSNHYKFIDSLQEHINTKYGLESPKTNSRLELTENSDFISRYKGDVFTGSNKSIKNEIINAVLDKNITHYDEFMAYLSVNNEVKVRNIGKPTAYLNIKPTNHEKGINLKEAFFNKDFIELPTEEKVKFLNGSSNNHYISNGKSSEAIKEDIKQNLDEWHKTKAREIKYINSASTKLRKSYYQSDTATKSAILDSRQEDFYTKHRKVHDEGNTNTRGTISTIAENLRAADSNLSTTHGIARNPEQARRNVATRRDRGIIEAIARGLGRDQSHRKSQPALAKSTDLDGRLADTVPAQMLVELYSSQQKDAFNKIIEFNEIKQHLHADVLLNYLHQTHGLIQEKYSVSKGKDGTDRIKVGNRNLNVSDFLTKEMHIPFNEAVPILTNAYRYQNKLEPLKNQRTTTNQALWKQFRAELGTKLKEKREAAWTLQKQSENQRRHSNRAIYQAEKKRIQTERNRATKAIQLSLARTAKAEKDMELKNQIKQERDLLKERFKRKPLLEQYKEFLADLASQDNVEALKELRKQSSTQEHYQHSSTITSPSLDEELNTRLLPRLKYTVDSQSGSVSYFKNSQVILTDSIHRVRVEKEERDNAELGLRLAMHKFGSRLNINGSDNFKSMIVDIAAQNGLNVVFSDAKMNEKLQKSIELRKIGQAYTAHFKQLQQESAKNQEKAKGIKQIVMKIKKRRRKK